MIGIIQPKNNNNELFQMGCIGKITSYIETPDYRLVLNLEGVCRFVLHERNLTSMVIIKQQLIAKIIYLI